MLSPRQLHYAESLSTDAQSAHTPGASAHATQAAGAQQRSRSPLPARGSAAGRGHVGSSSPSFRFLSGPGGGPAMFNYSPPPPMPRVPWQLQPHSIPEHMQHPDTQSSSHFQAPSHFQPPSIPEHWDTSAQPGAPEIPWAASALTSQSGNASAMLDTPLETGCASSARVLSASCGGSGLDSHLLAPQPVPAGQGGAARAAAHTAAQRSGSTPHGAAAHSAGASHQHRVSGEATRSGQSAASEGGSTRLSQASGWVQPHTVWPPLSEPYTPAAPRSQPAVPTTGRAGAATNDTASSALQAERCSLFDAVFSRQVRGPRSVPGPARESRVAPNATVAGPRLGASSAQRERSAQRSLSRTSQSGSERGGASSMPLAPDRRSASGALNTRASTHSVPPAGPSQRCTRAATRHNMGHDRVPGAALQQPRSAVHNVRASCPTPPVPGRMGRAASSVDRVPPLPVRGNGTAAAHARRRSMPPRSPCAQDVVDRIAEAQQRAQPRRVQSYGPQNSARRAAAARAGRSGGNSAGIGEGSSAAAEIRPAQSGQHRTGRRPVRQQGKALWR